MTTTDVDVVAEEDPGAGLAARRVHLLGTDIGPLGHLAAERRRLSQLRWEHFDAVPMAATLGAEIRGLDLTTALPPAVVDELHQAWLDYKVLFFRDQPLTPDQHLAFARCFGDLEVHPFIPGNENHPELVHFEKGADVGGYENGWHHDVTWRAIPSKAAVLHALSVPAVGGDTLFADMYAAYEGLSDELKATVEDLVAVHDFAQAFGAQVPADKRDQMRRQYPLVEHPVVVTHPETGRRVLYVNRFFVSHFVGQTREESTALLQTLCDQAAIVEYQCRFQWQPHSVAMWDNTAVQHYAASDYWPDIRIMERASIIGTTPR